MSNYFRIKSSLPALGSPVLENRWKLVILTIWWMETKVTFYDWRALFSIIFVTSKNAKKKINIWRQLYWKSFAKILFVVIGRVLNIEEIISLKWKKSEDRRIIYYNKYGFKSRRFWIGFNFKSKGKYNLILYFMVC